MPVLPAWCLRPGGQPASGTNAGPVPHNRDRCGNDDEPPAAVEEIPDGQREVPRDWLQQVVDRLQELVDRCPATPQPTGQRAFRRPQTLDPLLHSP